MSEDSHKSALGPIPKAWRDLVRRALDRRNKKELIVTKYANDDWSALFPEGYISDLYNALDNALNDDHILGQKITDMTPAGEAYEFFFFHNGRKLYGKVNLLRPDQKNIIIVSAHIPHKGDTL